MNPNPSHPKFWIRVVVKSFILLTIINFIFPYLSASIPYGKISLYNLLFPGRLRLPYGDNPSQSYNLTLDNLDAMFSSHILSDARKSSSEFRVVVIGDSATWGYLLTPAQTLTSYLNDLALQTPDGRQMVFFNLGYPVMSLTKDLVILSRALEYQPDLILWLVTLESFPKDKQLSAPIIERNREQIYPFLHQIGLSSALSLPPNHSASFWNQTLVAKRRELADIIRLQLYGFLWAATNIDQAIPADIPLRQEDLSDDLAFHDFQPPDFPSDALAFEVINAAYRVAQPIPIILINEPMYISNGKNSDIRYNFYYPRWAYDLYRQKLASTCHDNNWECWDLWNLIPPDEFTNTAIHMTPAGSRQTAAKIADLLSNWLQTAP